MKNFQILLIAILLCVFSVGGAVAGKVSSYTELADPALDDTVLTNDISDTTMATSGTTKKLRLRNIPISEPMQNALNLKMDASHPASGITNAGSGMVITAAERTKLAGIEDSADANPLVATDGEITTGTETAPRLISPAQAKLAAQTFGGSTDTDDQTAAEVSFTPTGSIAATDVQAAVAEVDAEKEPALGNPPVDGRVLSSTAAGVRSWIDNGSGSDDQTAAEVPNTPAGNIVATNVQDAINELDGQDTALDAAKEDNLGNPAVDGYVLSSTTGGVRSWIQSGTGSGDISGVLGDSTGEVPVLYQGWIAFETIDATPNVSAGQHFKTVDTTTIVDFDDGGDSSTLQDGRMLSVLCLHTATFDFTSSGLFSILGADYTPTVGQIMEFKYDATNDLWRWQNPTHPPVTLTAGTDTLSLSGQQLTVDAFIEDIAELSSAFDDRILFFDYSTDQVTFLSIGAGLTITDTTIAATASATALDDVADPDADTTIAQAGFKTTWTSTLNTAGAVHTFSNTTADLTADVSFIDFKYTDDGDANGFFMRGYDNAGADLKWSIGADGDGSFNSLTTPASDDPTAYWNELDGQDWWVGSNDSLGTFEFRTSATPGSGLKMSLTEDTGILSLLGGMDGIGAVGLTYGSADILSHTFITDNTGDGEIVLPNDSIGAAEINDWYAYDILPIVWGKDGTVPPDALNDGVGRSPYQYRTFDHAADEDVNFVWFVPSDLSGTTIQYRVKYMVTAITGPTATEGVAFSLAGVSIGNNDATNAAKGTAVTVTDDTLNASQWDLLITDWSGNVTITNLAPGEVAELNFERTTANAVDDYAQLVGVIAVELRYVQNVAR